MGNPFSSGSQSNQGLANFGQMASQGSKGGAGGAGASNGAGASGLTQLFQQLLQKQGNQGPGLYSPLDKTPAGAAETSTMMNSMPAVPYIPTGTGNPQIF